MKKIILISLLPILFSPYIWAVTANINYQGRLLDNAGIPVSATDMAFVLRVYDASSNGNLVYSENHTVTVDDGTYSFIIGNGSGGSPTYGPDLFDTTGELWVEVEVETEILTPRHRLLSAPFSVQSDNAQTLQGNIPSDFAAATELQALVTQLKDLCLINGGAWSNTTNNCEYDVSSIVTINVLPAGGGYVPVSLLSLAGPDLCDESHYHGAPVLNCSGQLVGETQGSCGYGKVSAVLSINAELCLNYQ